MVFLELRWDSRVTMGITGFLLCWPWEAPSSIRVARGLSRVHPAASLPRATSWALATKRGPVWRVASSRGREGEEVVQGQKWSPSADLEDLGRVNATEPEGKRRAQQREWAVWGSNFSLRVGVCASGRLSCVRFFATPWTIQSMEFSRPQYWSW